MTEAYALAKEGEHYIKTYLKEMYNTISGVYSGDYKDSKSFYSKLNEVVTPKLKELIYSQKNAKAKSQEASEKIEKLFDAVVEDIKVFFTSHFKFFFLSSFPFSSSLPLFNLSSLSPFSLLSFPSFPFSPHPLFFMFLFAVIYYLFLFQTVYPSATKLDRPADMTVSVDIKTGYKTFSKYAEEFADRVVKMLDEVKKNENKKIETTKEIVGKFLAAEKPNILSETHLPNGIKGTTKTIKDNVRESINTLINKYLIKIIENTPSSSSSFSSSKSSSSSKVPNPNKVKKDEIEPQINELDDGTENNADETTDTSSESSNNGKKNESESKADDDSSNQGNFEELLENDLTKVDSVVDKAYATAKEGETLIKSYIKELYNALTA